MGQKVLVVDDEVDFVDAVKMRLEANGYEVITAYNGKEGLDKAASEMPSLIFLDLVMPKVNGFEMLSRLKEDTALCHIPVVIMTAKCETEYVFDAGKLGAEDYIVKPVSMDGIIQIAQKYIS
jgi:DNA-binding response OmpR family regulator